MGFAGNLSTLSLVEVLQTINRIRATGVLRLAAAETGRDVVFVEGEIIGVGFRAGEEKLTLLRRLIMEGRIDPDAAAAISSSRQESALVLNALIDRGTISQADVNEAQQRQAEDELYNLCSWDFADFVFQDATAEDPATLQQVEVAKGNPLRINVNSLLMEAARRIDEWANLRQAIRSEDAVLGPAEGREQELLSASKGYPGSAIVPLIDAVRTVREIVSDTIATRLDVYGVLAELIKDGLVAVLARDDILAHGDYQFGRRDYIKAARLFRRALSEDPDQATMAKLADCLQLLGEAPEAAGCFSQLALGYLDKGQGDEAISSAHRAVRLDSDDPNLRLILVRCLLDVGKTPEAVAELRQITARYLELGQLEDARGTCLKILELDPENQDARREMARIFATAERDKDSEDVVVCVQCGHVNHREAKACSECEAPLRLACQSCARTVAVSDRLCIFCGANPHLAGSKRKLLASPTTTRIVAKGAIKPGAKDGKGTRFWSNQLEDAVKGARTLEESGDFSAALAAWREVAKANPDNKELLGHIRELEGRVNDDFAERMIDRGHQLRRVRRFLAAMKSYQAAIRAIPETDPRVPRLKEILVSTRKHHQRIMVIYTAAFIAIGVFGWLVARPYVLLNGFRGDLSTAGRMLDSVPGGTSPATFAALDLVGAEVGKLDESARRLGSSNAAAEARINLNEFTGRLFSARLAVIEGAIKEIAAAIANGDIVRAEQLLGRLRQPEYRDIARNRLKPLEDELAAASSRQSDIEDQRKQAPERLQQLKAMETAGNLGAALGGYRLLANVKHPTASPAAQEGIARLEPRESAFIAAFAQAQQQMGVDLARSEAALVALEAEARSWGRETDWAGLRSEVAKRVQAAAVGYQKLGASATPEALSEYIAAHPAAAQVAQAKARLDLLAQSQRSRDEQLQAWRTAMADGQTEQAWRIARNLFAGGGTLPAELRLPLRIETAPAGAQVLIDGMAAGTTPCVIGVRPEQAAAEVRLTMPGWQPARRSVAEIAGEWRWQASMARATRWQASLGRAVTAVMVLPDGGVLALSGEVLHHFSADGKPLWRTSIATADDLSDPEHFRLAHQPQLHRDLMLLGLPNKDVVVISAKGVVESRLPSVAAVRGRPQIYSNDLLGGQTRVAYAADALYVGDLGAEIGRIALPSAALSGPLTFPKGPDRILAVATIQGQLVAFEESTKQRLWQYDLKATEIGQLIPSGSDSALAILDGSRVASWRIAAAGATLRWNTALPGAAVGEPAVAAGGVLWIAAGSALVRVSADGVATPLALPSPASTPASAGGDLAAVGVRSGQVLVYRQGTLLWSTRCETAPVAVACTGDVVVVGMADGTLATYSP